MIYFKKNFNKKNNKNKKKEHKKKDMNNKNFSKCFKISTIYLFLTTRRLIFSGTLYNLFVTLRTINLPVGSGKIIKVNVWWRGVYSNQAFVIKSICCIYQQCFLAKKCPEIYYLFCFLNTGHLCRR